MADMQAQMDQMNAAQAAAAQQEAVDKAVADALAAKEAAAAPAAPAGGDTMAELQKLVDLKTQGLLTDEEFAAMKSKLLGT